VLESICFSRHFDISEAEELISRPFLIEPTGPFKMPTPEPEAGPSTGGPSRANKRKGPAQKGIFFPAHSSSAEKFSSQNMPNEIKNFFKKQVKKRHIQKILSKEFLKLIGTSLAKSTWKRYNSAWNLWQKFCKDLHLNCFKISESKKLSFICWCSKNCSIKSSTINMYLSAISKVFRLAKGKSNNDIQKQLLKGLENTSSKKFFKKKSQIRPITLSLLAKFKNSLRSGEKSDLEKLSLWGAAVVAFWGCFRLGELLCREKFRFDKYTDLLWKDIKFVDKQVLICIKSGKTSGSKPVTVRLGSLPNKKFCPRSALKRLKNFQKAKNFYNPRLPVFRTSIEKGGSKNLRPWDLVKEFKKFSIRKSDFSGKSFRSGIPSILASSHRRFKANVLQNFGRWKSQAFRAYIRGEENMDMYKKVTEFVLTSFFAQAQQKRG
jgi:Phage integrase SAM-like domain